MLKETGMNSQELMARPPADGGSGTGFVTGTTCTSSGTYRASNKYMDVVMAVAVGEVFLPGPDGNKTTWYALAPSLSSNKKGEFSSVKVAAGSI
jgi:hypothetical protein